MSRQSPSAPHRIVRPLACAALVITALIQGSAGAETYLADDCRNPNTLCAAPNVPPWGYQGSNLYSHGPFETLEAAIEAGKAYYINTYDGRICTIEGYPHRRDGRTQRRLHVHVRRPR